jgi:basic membrane protein A
VPGTKTIVQYSNDFGAQDKCQAVAQNEIGQGAKVLFQVAGGCGIGALKAADTAGLWGIGVDSDEYKDAKRILTSATKHTDTGVYNAITEAAAGKFQGGTDVLFNLKNNGVGVGKINPAVPKAWITLMNSYKAKIIAGTLKIPVSL